jgi:uncharacterized membrane protein required for colicin V production
MKNFQPSIFDLILAIVILLGIVRGRKRGISNELIDVFEWIAIVAVGGLTYRMVGGAISQYTQLPATFAHLLGYMVAAAITAFIFKAIKRGVGEKLVQGDTFGRFEFYLGMVAGAVRFACMLLFALALLHAKYTTPAERAQSAQAQRDALGSITIPTLAGIQESVFQQSISGKFIDKNLWMVLIQPVRPGAPRETMGRARERVVNEAGGK